MSDDLTGSIPPPEPVGADAWPWYFGLLTLVIGLFGSFFVSAVLAGIWLAAGGDVDDSGFIVIGTAVQAGVFIGTAYGVGRSRGPVSGRDFGLVRAPFWPTVGKMAATIVSYFVLLAIWNALVNLSADDTPDKLGAGSGTLGMLCFAVLVAVFAPISEEIFFRGMIFRAFANGIGVWGGAIASGLLFGALHIDSFASGRLLQVVPLALLGIMFALLYAWSGTLYATIALHATNNSLAVLVYADDHHSDFGVALAIGLWLLMMIGCAVGWKLTDRAAPPTAPQAPPPPPSPGAPVFVQPGQAPPAAPPSVPPPGQPQYPPPRPEHPDFPWGQP